MIARKRVHSPSLSGFSFKDFLSSKELSSIFFHLHNNSLFIRNFFNIYFPQDGGNNVKKLFAILIVGIISMSLFAAGDTDQTGDQSLANVQKKGTFVLGLDDSFPPMGYRDESGEIVGFDIDLAREVAKRLGVELVPQAIDWSAKEQELATGNIDCIWNGFTVTPEREEMMTFSAPYVNNAQVVVVKGSSSVQDIEDLAGATIGVQAGSSGQVAIEDNPDFSASIGEVIEFKDYLTALMDLEAGGVDAVVMDVIVANDNISRSGKDFKILPGSLADEEYAIGFRKGDLALCEAVDSALLGMAEDGTLAEISTAWFGQDITTIGK